MKLSKDGRILIKVNISDLKNDGSFVIPKGVTSIDIGAFWRCYELKQVTIPEGVTSIDILAFEGCKSLKQITIPKSMTSIGGSAFAGCPLKIIWINDSDESVRNRIIGLLPSKLHKKVSAYSVNELSDIWEEELERINKTPETNRLCRFFNPDAEVEGPHLPWEILAFINTFKESYYYRTAKDLIREVPLPTNPEDKQVYKDKIRRIVDECIKEAVHMSQEPNNQEPNNQEPNNQEPNNHSLLLNALSNALTVISALRGLAPMVTALAEAFPSQEISGKKRKRECGSNPDTDKNSAEKGKEQVSESEKKRPKRSFFAEKQSENQVFLPNQNSLGL